jgi:uncharacterized protein YycO
MIELLFYKPANLIGKLVCWQTRSQFCHVAVHFEDCTVIEALYKDGVIKRNYDKDKDTDCITLRICVDKTAEESIHCWLENQVGKPYDYLAILRFLSRRKMYSNNRWFCSELAYEAFQQAGVNLLKHTQPWEVSPGLLLRSPLLMSG